VLLSVAAVERPRASNPIYGAAKAGLDALAQGLSDAIASSGVRVLVVRPGFVKTRMTAGLEPAPFATTPRSSRRRRSLLRADALERSGCPDGSG
jgi:decaprenylphospho-beta-D-erythro-pentofuranosid-2-ulose 2-reductase